MSLLSQETKLTHRENLVALSSKPSSIKRAIQYLVQYFFVKLHEIKTLLGEASIYSSIAQSTELSIQLAHQASFYIFSLDFGCFIVGLVYQVYKIWTPSGVVDSDTWYRV